MSDEEEIEYVSKSQIKRECDALTALGIELVALPEQDINNIPMSDILRHAIHEAKNIRKHSAIKRQRQYIGKLIRKEDHDEIKAQLDRIKEPAQQQNAQFKKMERWRDRMLDEGDNVINEFIGEHHEADRQKLRQLVKNAVRDRLENRPPSNARKLFKYIREIIENSEEQL